MVGSMSASLGAQSNQMVPAGGSSKAFNKTFEERSAIRSASSMIMIWYLLTDPPKCDAETSCRISSMEMITFSDARTETSGWEPDCTMRQLLQAPQPAFSQSNEAANAIAAFDRPEPGGPVRSQAWFNPSSLLATAWRS
jgi:hypothetical protein